MDLSTTLLEDVSHDMQTHTARKKLLFKKVIKRYDRCKMIFCVSC